jgi:hypothetical protein
MSKHVAALAQARVLLGHAEPLLADLRGTLGRWNRYSGRRPVDGYYARLGTPDRDLDEVRPPDSITIDVMTRRVSAEFPAWSSLRPEAVPEIAAAGFQRLVAVVAAHPDGRVREAATRLLADSGNQHLTTLVLRCIDHVPAVRSVAAAAIENVLDRDPMDLRESDYAILKRPRATRLVPALATRAILVQATNVYVRRRDREFVDLIQTVGPDALVEVDDLPTSDGTALLDVLTAAEISATSAQVPVLLRGETVFRTRILVRAADEARAALVIRGAGLGRHPRT